MSLHIKLPVSVLLLMYFFAHFSGFVFIFLPTAHPPPPSLQDRSQASYLSHIAKGKGKISGSAKLCATHTGQASPDHHIAQDALNSHLSLFMISAELFGNLFFFPPSLA